MDVLSENNNYEYYLLTGARNFFFIVLVSYTAQVKSLLSIDRLFIT